MKETFPTNQDSTISERLQSEITDLSHDPKVRVPVLRNKDQLNLSRQQIENKWNILTEVIKRESLCDEETRDTLASFVGQPLEELLPEKVIGAITANNQRTRHHLEKSAQLESYLSLPRVPEDQQGVDLYSSKHLPDMDDSVRYEKADDEGKIALLRRMVETGTFSTGITGPEKQLVQTRFRYARDVKILALGAELLQNHVMVETLEGGHLSLPSGVQIEINPNLKSEIASILNPGQWKYRQMMEGNRSFVVEIGSTKYILKERRTQKHGLKSASAAISIPEEVKIAQELGDIPEIENGDIAISWEKAVCAVMYPDGYEFALYAFEDDLIDAQAIDSSLPFEIISHREQFEEEYKLIATQTAKAKQNPMVAEFIKVNNKIYEESDTEKVIKKLITKISSFFSKKEGQGKDQEHQGLSFEEFAFIKSALMIAEASKGLVQHIYEKGYISTDFLQYSFRLVEKNGKLKLEIIGFDTEHFKPVDEVAKINEENNREKASQKENLFDALRSVRGGKTSGQIAACYIMFEQKNLL